MGIKAGMKVRLNCVISNSSTASMLPFNYLVDSKKYRNPSEIFNKLGIFNNDSLFTNYTNAHFMYELVDLIKDNKHLGDMLNSIL